MVFRMPSIQPPMDTSTIVVTGRTRCVATSAMNSGDQAGVIPAL